MTTELHVDRSPEWLASRRPITSQNGAVVWRASDAREEASSRQIKCPGQGGCRCFGVLTSHWIPLGFRFGKSIVGSWQVDV